MTECVHVLVLGEGSMIDSIGGVYAHEDRVNQAIDVIELRNQWHGTEQWLDYHTFPLNRTNPF